MTLKVTHGPLAAAASPRLGYPRGTMHSATTGRHGMFGKPRRALVSERERPWTEYTTHTLAGCIHIGDILARHAAGTGQGEHSAQGAARGRGPSRHTPTARVSRGGPVWVTFVDGGTVTHGQDDVSRQSKSRLQARSPQTCLLDLCPDQKFVGSEETGTDCTLMVEDRLV